MAGGDSIPVLGGLRMHTVAFVTDRTPSDAVALAVRSNAGLQIRVLAPPSEQERIHSLGAEWANMTAQGKRAHAFGKLYRQGAPGSRDYWRFCHTRWIVLAGDLLDNPPPHNAGIAVLDDDVLLFERLSQRLEETGRFHSESQAESVMNGAFVLASPGVLTRFAAWLWALYNLPSASLSAIAWRFGTIKRRADLNERQLARMDPIFIREGQYAHFTDMHAIDAFRFLSRSAQLPIQLRVIWSAGYRRSTCTAVHKLDKPEDGDGATRLLIWREGAPRISSSGKPLCFVHLQGPAAKRQYEYMKPFLIGLPNRSSHIKYRY